jgi:hypothetical protein
MCFELTQDQAESRMVNMRLRDIYASGRNFYIHLKMNLIFRCNVQRLVDYYCTLGTKYRLRGFHHPRAPKKVNATVLTLSYLVLALLCPAQIPLAFGSEMLRTDHTTFGSVPV